MEVSLWCLLVVELGFIHRCPGLSVSSSTSPFSACRALVDEMDWAISQIDPKKMIQTGSFRINPDGSQSIREVSVNVQKKRSNVFIIQIHKNKLYVIYIIAFIYYSFIFTTYVQEHLIGLRIF